MSEWRVAWSHQIDGPVNDVKVDSNGMLICTGQSLIALRSDGTTAWRSDHIFDTYSAESSDSVVALLTGTSIHVFNRSTGSPLSDGRSFQEVIEKRFIVQEGVGLPLIEEIIYIF